MGWIKRMRLKNALFTMMFFGLLLASLLSVCAFIGCTQLVGILPQTTASIDISTDPAVTVDVPEPAAWSTAVGWLLGVLQIVLPILIFTVVIMLTSILFYRAKLKEPLYILKSSAQRIMENDLDFVIPAPSAQDELGQLCRAFEKMRETLLVNNQMLWRQAEERKRLNAAFAHDLRNPVTVLKGTAKLLRKGIQVEQTLDRLENNTLRIEQYIESMSTIQRLEQVPVRKKKVPYALLSGELADTVRLLAPGLSCRMIMPGTGSSRAEASGTGAAEACTAPAKTAAAEKARASAEAEAAESLTIDPGLFMTVAENLIANGARYAKCELTVGLEVKDSFLLLSVMDDGPGFPAELLRDGPKPFGKAGEHTKSSEIFTDGAKPCKAPAENTAHFGMGLYSCQTICLKHGGELTLENGEGCGAKATACFKI